jgi:predicted nucleic acid-binding protein
MFVDANIFMTAALASGPKAERCRAFLRRVESGEQRAITSVLVLDEVLKVIENGCASREKAAARTRKFATLPNLRVCEVTQRHFLDSLEFFGQGLEPRDALHVAVALGNSAEKILSYDRDFDSVRKIKRVEP